MEIYERIRHLRKEVLNLSQASFGSRLGVNRDVINNIENNRLAKPEQKLSLLKLICKEFSVSEEWLMNGTGEMFESNEAEYGTMIDQIMAGENEFAKGIFKTFATFDKKDWDALYKMIKKYNSVSGSEESEENDDKSYLDPIAAHERTDTKVTKEMIEHDNALMDDDSLWGK